MLRPRPRMRTRAAAWPAVLLAVGAVSLSGCGSSPSMPTRDQAFQLGEVQINQILLALNRPPTTQFTYAEGPCHETDDAHGHVNVDYTIPGQYPAAQAQALMSSVASAMKQLGLGTPVSETQPDGVYVQNADYGLLFDIDGGYLTFAYQNCYATPAPTVSPGLSGVLAPLTASPAPTSTAQPPAALPPSGEASPPNTWPPSSGD